MSSKLAALATLLLSLHSPASHAADPLVAESKSPNLVKAEGEVNRVLPDGKLSALVAGETLEAGWMIRTGENSGAVVRYTEGSEVLIGNGSEIEILESEGSASRIELHKGLLRGVIQKKLENKANEPVFYFRSKAAVMGVRGTDFFYGFDSAAGKAQIHTLEGTVEVAKDQATILQNQGSMVAQNQTISADPSGLGNVSPFDPQQFLQSLQATQPLLAAAGSPATPPAPSPAPPAATAAAGAGLGALALLGGGDDDKDEPSEPKKDEKKEEVAKAEDAPRDTAGFKLGRFTLSASNPTYDGESQGFNLEVAWNPEIRLADAFAIRGHLGFWPNSFKTSPFLVIAGAPEETNSYLIYGMHAEATVWKGLTVGGAYLIYNIANIESDAPSLQSAAGLHAEIAWRFHDLFLLDRVTFSIGTPEGFGSNFLGAPSDSFSVMRVSMGLRF